MSTKHEDFSRAKPIIELSPISKNEDVYEYYSINGAFLTKEEYCAHVNETAWPRLTIDSCGTKVWKNKEGLLHREDGPAKEWPNGTYSYYINGLRHRDDGPAAMNDDGTLFWYIDGERHREDRPACECTNGSKYWYLHDKLHRLDGPAVKNADGSKEWWVNGKKLTEEEFHADLSACLGDKI